MTGGTPRPPKGLFTRVFDLDPGGPADGSPARPVVKLVDLVITEGLRSKAEQISVKGETGGIGIYYLIGGQWRQVMKIPVAAGGPMANRLKVMANLDISRRPTQQGLLHVRLGGVEYAFDITTTLSASGGEDVLLVIRDAGLSNEAAQPGAS